MKVFRSYVKNKNMPEGCIDENYTVEESINFLLDMLKVWNILKSCLVEMNLGMIKKETLDNMGIPYLVELLLN